MKRNSAPINYLSRSAMVVLVAGMAAFTTGCMTANMKVSPTARIQNAPDKKIALSVGLMLEDRFCTNRFIPFGGALTYPFGPTLKQQSISLCQQCFDKVIVSTNGVVPAGVNAVLTPEMHRCGIGYAASGGGQDITLLLQWKLGTGDSRNILWMTTVDGHANGGRSKVFQLLFDDLATKSCRAFQESPEIRQLTSQAQQRPVIN